MASQVLATSASDTMKAYWKFDESSGNATNSSDDGFTLTNNNVTYTTGQKGNAAVFNGTNSSFSAAGPNLANSSFTISAWLNVNNLSATQVWFALGSSSSTNNALHLRLNTNGSLHFGFFSNDMDSSAGVITAGNWYQVIYTYNSSNRARAIYVNGVSVGTNTASANFTGNTTMTIGTWNGFERWNGKIDDVRIYNRVLTASEISALSTGANTSASWTGATSSDFETASNWDINAVPDPYTILTFPSTTNHAVLSANESAASATINSGAILDLAGFALSFNDGGSLTNNGTLWLSGPPAASSDSSSSSSNNSISPACTDTAPKEAPDIFRADAAGTYVNLYFNTVKGATGYNFNYGLATEANQFGDSLNDSGPFWILGRTISWLVPNTTYYFKAQAVNGCNTGPWSNTVKVKTKTKSTKINEWFANLVKT